ncbi:MAG: ABC transporter ATP-binding protein [Rhodospirillales bacterium]
MTDRARETVTRAAEVSIENVNLSFGETHVLIDVNLKVEPGEFFAFLGPSGSGKTTLLRFIAGFSAAQSGRVLIAGKDVTYLPPWKRDVGMVFQNYALWPHMTVHKNVAFGLEERKLPRKLISQRADAVLELIGLLDLAGRRPSQLSGGQQQRVALARTIVVEPLVLLLDEPLSNLDANLRVQMRRELVELQRKLSLTTIFVTHDQEEANAISDRIAVLNDGVIQQVGSPIELYDRPVNRFVADFLGSANLIDGVVEKADGRTLFRASDDIIIPVNGGGIEATGELTAMFRPQSLSIRGAGDPPTEMAARLSGRVEHREFLGSLVRYTVAVGRHALLVDDSHQAGRRTYDIGEEVVLYLDTKQVQLLPG